LDHNNSIKVYNKTDTLLRIETTINSTREFKVYRSPKDDPRQEPSWQYCRKGVSDLHRRCQISNQANERYALALGMTLVEDRLKDVLGPACRRVKKKGRCYRALNPWSPQDFQLLTFFGKGELAINGFRNKDLRRFLYGEAGGDADPLELRRRTGRVSRLLDYCEPMGSSAKFRMLTAMFGLKKAAALPRPYCAPQTLISKRLRNLPHENVAQKTRK